MPLAEADHLPGKGIFVPDAAKIDFPYDKVISGVTSASIAHLRSTEPRRLFLPGWDIAQVSEEPGIPLRDSRREQRQRAP
jgi:hypothetical protein